MRILRHAAYLIFSLVLIQVSVGQDSPDSRTLVFVPESTVVEKGRNFSIAFVLPETDPQLVRVSLSGIPAGMRIIRGPYVRAFEDDATRVSYTLRADRTGAFRFNPFTVTIDGTEWFTEPFVVSAGTVSGTAMVLPIDPVWRAEKQEVYLGETVSVYLELRDNRTVDLVDDVLAPAPNSGVFEEAPQLGRVIEEKIGPTVLYQVPVTAYAFTPARAGRNTIPSATVSVGPQTAKTGPLTIVVNSLPAEVADTGAVGNFRASSTISTLKAAVGEEVVLTTVVSGNGNLGYLRIQDPEVTGMIQVTRNDVLDVRVSSEGYVGSHTSTHRYAAEIAGTGKISVPSFWWIDPDTQTVRNTSEQTFTLEIVGPDESVDADADKTLPFELVDPAELVATRSAKLTHIAWLYALFLPGPLSAAIIWIVSLFQKRVGKGGGERRGQRGGKRGGKRGGQRGGKRSSHVRTTGITIIASVFLLSAGPNTGSVNIAELEKANAAYYQEEFQEAATVFAAAVSENSGNPNLRYNLALSLFMSGKTGPAVHEARVAVRLRPSNALYRDLLDWMELTSGVERGVPPAGIIDPDFAFIACILSANALIILLVIGRVRRMGSIIIALILSSVLLAGSATTLLIVNREVSQPKGVIIVDEAVMRKIPDDRSNSWRSLKAGTSVAVKGYSDGFTLVETGYGLKGWIADEGIVHDDEILPVTEIAPEGVE